MEFADSLYNLGDLSVLGGYIWYKCRLGKE